MLITVIAIAIATLAVPVLVGWATASPAKSSLQFWSAHPWLFFWCLPLVVVAAQLPLVIMRRQVTTPPQVIGWLGTALVLATGVIIIASAVQGIRVTVARSRSRAAVVLNLLAMQGSLGVLLSGGPASLGLPMSESVAMVLTVSLGVAFAAWIGVMALASRTAATWLGRTSRN